MRNPWGFTPVYMATDTPDIMRRLIDEGVDVNEQCGERQEAPLHLAAVMGSVTAFKVVGFKE